MTFSGSFCTKKLENMRCLFSSPNTYNLDRHYVHYIVNTCWLVLYTSLVPHKLPVLKPTLRVYTLPLLRKTCSKCLHAHRDFSSMCELSPFHTWLPSASFTRWAGSLSWLPASCQLPSRPVPFTSALEPLDILPLHRLCLSLLLIFSICFSNIFPFT